MNDLIFDCNELSIAVKSVSTILRDNANIPIFYGMMKFENFSDNLVMLTTNNGEIQKSALIKTSERVEFEPFTILGATRFNKAVQALDKSKDVKIKVDDNGLIMRNGRSRFKFSISSDGIEMPIFENIKGTAVDSANHKHKVAHAIPRDDVRYFLNGMLIDIHEKGTSLVATDGHRMSVTHISDITGDERAIIPRDSVSHFDGVVRFNNNFIEGSDTISRCIEGTYPDWKRIIPSHCEMFYIVNKDELLIALRALQASSDEKGDGLHFDFEKDKLVIHNETARSELDCTSDYGEPVKTAFNMSYIIDVINVVDSDTIRFEFASSASQVTIRDGDSIHVVMPMRI